MVSFCWKAIITFITPFYLVAAQAGDTGFPDWLGGKPDVVMRSELCGVYEWFIGEADKQSEGLASKGDLSSQRVVNIANKLVDHHRNTPEGEYSGEVKYLIIGEKKAFHFEFQITNEELERYLNKRCNE